MAPRIVMVLFLALFPAVSSIASESCGPMQSKFVDCAVGPSEIELEMQLAAERGNRYLQRKRQEARGASSLMQAGTRTQKALYVQEASPAGAMPDGWMAPTAFNPFKSGDPRLAELLAFMKKQLGSHGSP